MSRYVPHQRHPTTIGDYVDAGPQEAFGAVGNYVDVPGYMGENGAIIAVGAVGMLLSTVLTGFTVYGIYKFATRKKK
jgi:hypothetical protein